MVACRRLLCGSSTEVVDGDDSASWFPSPTSSFRRALEVVVEAIVVDVGVGEGEVVPSSLGVRLDLLPRDENLLIKKEDMLFLYNY